MSLASADLPSDPDALRAFAQACQSELAEATAELQAARLAVQLRTLEIEKLKFQIAKLRRMHTARPGRPRHAGASFGLEIHRSPAALLAERDLCPRRARSRPLDIERLGSARRSGCCSRSSWGSSSTCLPL